MNGRKATFLLAALFLLQAFAVPAVSQQGDGIIVNGAKEVRETSVSLAQGLRTSIAQVPPRVVVQYGDTIRKISPLGMPGALQALLGQVPDRVVIQYAKVNRSLPLVYPVALFNDTTAPQISEISVNVMGCDGVLIAWRTDELADSEVVFGEQSGQYPHTVSDPLYGKHHEMALTGLVPGTYYYKVRSTDRSGNTATSPERSFTLACLYLPLAGRNSR